MPKFEGKEIEVTASTGRVFKLRELSAYEQMIADGFGDGENTAAAVYARTAAAIVAIDGDHAKGAGGSALSIQGVLQGLGGKEIDDLMMAIFQNFAPKPAELKNESAPSA